MTEREPRPVAEGLAAVISALRGPDVSTVRGVFGGWAEAVGPQVAAHATPIRLDGTVLRVEVDEPGWATQLRFLEADLLARLASTGSTVTSIEVVVRGPRGRGRSRTAFDSRPERPTPKR